MFTKIGNLSLGLGILFTVSAWSSDYGGWASSLAQILIFPIGLFISLCVLVVASSSLQKIAFFLSLTLNLGLMIFALFDRNRYGRLPEESQDLLLSSMFVLGLLLVDFYFRKKMKTSLLSQIKKILFLPRKRMK